MRMIIDMLVFFSMRLRMLVDLVMVFVCVFCVCGKNEDMGSL